MTEDLSNVNCDGVGLVAEARVPTKTIIPVTKDQDLGDRRFSTDYLLHSLRKRTVSNAFVAILSHIAQATLNVASVMVLARLLAPRNFGLVAMFTAVTNVFIVVAHAGQIVDDMRPERAVERFSRLALGEQVEDVGGGLPYVGRNG
jgi:Polysaccharide biosynthesis protein